MRPRRLSAVLLAAALALPWATPPAGAATGGDAFLLTGAGTFLPGLGAVPEHQTFSFNGIVTVYGSSGVGGTFSCSMSGDETLGGVEGGVGTATGGCAPQTWCRAWVHQRLVATWSWACAVTSPAVHVGFMQCVYTTAGTPARSFTLTCTGAVLLV
jgi:hypothetical protein